jgi:hypothetical protein
LEEKEVEEAESGFGGRKKPQLLNITGGERELVVRRRAIGRARSTRARYIFKDMPRRDSIALYRLLNSQRQTVNAMAPNSSRFVGFTHNSLTGRAISARMLG